MSSWRGEVYDHIETYTYSRVAECSPFTTTLYSRERLQRLKITYTYSRVAESSSSTTTLYSRRRLQMLSTINWLRNFRRFYMSKCSLPSPILWCLQEYKCRWNPKQMIKGTSIIQINVHAQCFGPNTYFTINSVFIIATFFF